MRTVEDIKKSLHSQVCSTRSILRLSQTLGFELAFNEASSEQKLILLALIQKSDQDGVLKWVKQQLRDKRVIEEFSMQELRKIGQKLGVKDYNILPKSLLLPEIKIRGFES